MAPLRFAAAAVALAAAAVALFAGAPPAGAHAVLVGSSPPDGARLLAPPTEVVLEFNEPVSVELGGLRVYDAAGRRVDRGAVELDGRRVRVALAPGLPEGGYVVTWRVISADAHPVRGASVFIVGDGADPGLAERFLDDPAQRWWELAAALTRWLAYGGVLVAAGGVFFLGLVHRGGLRRPELSRMTLAAAAVGAAGVLAGIPVQAALATGMGAGAIAEEGVLAALMGEGVGWAVGFGLAGLAAVALGLAPDCRRARGEGAERAPRPGALVALPGAVLAAGSFAATGHNRAGEAVALATVAAVAHLLAAAAWLGGLALLWRLLRQPAGPAAAVLVTAVGGPLPGGPLPGGPLPGGPLPGGHECLAEAIGRFSTLAALSVIVLGAAGLALAWAEVGSLEALTTTPYGALLGAKVVVAALVGAVALYNNRVLVPAMRRGGAGGGALARMRATLKAEAVLLAAVLALTAVLVAVTPARTAAQGGVAERIVHLGEVGSVQLVLDPARAGRSTLHLFTFDPAGRPAEIAEAIVLEASLPEAGIGPLLREPPRVGAAHFLLEGHTFTTAGDWLVVVRARVDRFTELTGAARVEITR